MNKTSLLMIAHIAALLISLIAAATAMAAEIPREGVSVDYTHGPLAVSENGRFLIHSDGTPFFYLGDTAWELFHRLDRQDAELYLENRRQKGFTVIQAVVLAEFDGLGTPNAYGEKPLIDNDPAKPNEAYFDHVDFIVRKALEKGLCIGMLPTWGDKVGPIAWGTGPQIFTKENARVFGNYLGNRYKDYPNIIWILGGDRTPKGFEAVWRELAAGLKEGDGGKHLMTYHPQGGMSSSDVFHKETWLDFNMLQSSHGARDLANYDNITRDYKKKPVKPCIDGEPRYEDHPINWDPKNGWFDDYDVRQAAYWGVFAGAMGTTYGCHDIWQMLSESFPPVSSARTPWKIAMDLPGAWDMKHLRELMESRPMLARIPDQTMLKAGKGTGGSAIRITRGEDYAFVYSSAGKPFTLSLGVLSGEKVRAHWFNPREGTSSFLGEYPNQGVMEFVPPVPKTGRNQDWVLILDDASKGYAAPGVLTAIDYSSIAIQAAALIPAPTGANVTPPRPIVELLFEEVNDGKVANTGYSGDSYPFATLTSRVPNLLENTLSGTGRKALDFGTVASGYAVDLPGPVIPLSNLKAFTITGWLNCKSKKEGSGGNRIVSWINDGGEGVDLVYRSDGSLQFNVNQWDDNSPARSSEAMISTDAAAGKDNWVFFAVEYDSALPIDNVMFFFGRPGKVAAFDCSIDYSRGPVGSKIGPEFTVGNFNTATRRKAPDRMFRGIIDDIRVFDKTLTPDEIVAVQRL